jgi:hypothetical protein
MAVCGGPGQRITFLEIEKLCIGHARGLSCWFAVELRTRDSCARHRVVSDFARADSRVGKVAGVLTRRRDDDAVDPVGARGIDASLPQPQTSLPQSDRHSHQRDRLRAAADDGLNARYAPRPVCGDLLAKLPVALSGRPWACRTRVDAGKRNGGSRAKATKAKMTVVFLSIAVSIHASFMRLPLRSRANKDNGTEPCGGLSDEQASRPLPSSP